MLDRTKTRTIIARQNKAERKSPKINQSNSKGAL